jgi:hypothetical protein
MMKGYLLRFPMVFLMLLIVAFSACEKDKPVSLADDNQNQTAFLNFEFEAQFKGEKIDFSKQNYITDAQDTLKFSRIRFLLSDIALQQADGEWESVDTFLYVGLDQDKRTFQLSHAFQNKEYRKLRFVVGLDSAVNHGDPQQWSLGHPLNPLTNGMHWGWVGGYIFMITEGHHWLEGDSLRMMSFHMATLPYRKSIEVDIPASKSIKTGVNEWKIGVDMSRYFSTPNPYSLKVNGPSSHSGSPAEMERMSLLHANLSHVFSIMP